MVVHNQFKQTLTGEDDNPLEISDLKLMATYMEPCGSMEIKDVQLSNSFPQADEDVTVTVTLENNGLSKAKGYTMRVYQCVPSQEEVELKKYVSETDELVPFASDDEIIPGNGSI